MAIPSHFLARKFFKILPFFLWSFNFLNWKQGRFIIDFPLLMGFIAIAGVIFFGIASLLIFLK